MLLSFMFSSQGAAYWDMLVNPASTQQVHAVQGILISFLPIISFFIIELHCIYVGCVCAYSSIKQVVVHISSSDHVVSVAQWVGLRIVHSCGSEVIRTIMSTNDINICFDSKSTPSATHGGDECMRTVMLCREQTLVPIILSLYGCRLFHLV